MPSGLKATRAYRDLRRLYLWRQRLPTLGIASPGFNITFQPHPSEVLELIRKLRPQKCDKELIRIGGMRDGGYLIPDDLDGIEYCFSPGVGPSSEFENQLADRGIKSFLADYSVDRPAILRPEITFDKKYLGSTNSDQFLTLSSWKNKYLKNYEADLILQMDIEGAEYQVILNAPDELLSQFRILVIEFHHLQRLFDPFCLQLFSSCFEKLLASFCVVHIHPNNGWGSVKVDDIEVPRFMEFTFLNKKRLGRVEPC